MSRRDNRVQPPNLQIAALKEQMEGYDQILKEFAANIIRLLELQLHTMHMVARQRLLECPVCIRAADAEREKEAAANG